MLEVGLFSNLISCMYYSDDKSAKNLTIWTKYKCMLLPILNLIMIYIFFLLSTEHQDHTMATASTVAAKETIYKNSKGRTFIYKHWYFTLMVKQAIFKKYYVSLFI